MEKLEPVFLTVLTPTYNRARTLPNCYESLSGQTCKAFEWIVVDDGSPDGCPAICDEYAAADPRVTVIHQENAGLSAARNTALDVAHGKWTMFLDSDDWFEPDIVQKALAAAHESGSQIVAFDVDRTHGKKPEYPMVYPLSPGVHSGREALLNLCQTDWNWIWCRLYTTSLLDGIRFPVGEIYEDIATVHLIVERAQKVHVIREVGIHYRLRAGSIVMGDQEKASIVMLNHYLDRTNYYADNPEVWPSAMSGAARTALTRCIRLVKTGRYDELTRLRRFALDRGLRMTYGTRNQKIGWQLLTYCPPLFKLAAKRR